MAAVPGSGPRPEAPTTTPATIRCFLAEGLVLGLPLAAVLGALGGGEPGGRR